MRPKILGAKDTVYPKDTVKVPCFSWEGSPTKIDCRQKWAPPTQNTRFVQGIFGNTDRFSMVNTSFFSRGSTGYQLKNIYNIFGAGGGLLLGSPLDPAVYPCPALSSAQALHLADYNRHWAKEIWGRDAAKFGALWVRTGSIFV